MSEELKPCPFYGTGNLETTWNQSGRTSWDSQVECPECGAHGPVGLGSMQQTAIDDAIAAWNRRATPPAQGVVAVDQKPSFGLLLKLKTGETVLLAREWDDRDAMTTYACRSAGRLLVKHKARSMHAVRVLRKTTAEYL